MAKSDEPKRYEGIQNRVQFTAVIITLAFLLLVMQLWRLQVVDQGLYRAMAEEQRVWPKRLKSDRGIIYGRGGVVLADNRPSADIVMVPGDIPPEMREGVAESLDRLLGVPKEEILERIYQFRGEPFSQIPIKRDVTKYERVRVEEHTFELPGVLTVVHPQRRYRYGKVGGQLLGYLGEINREELAAQRDTYSMGDLIGRGGLEQMYESHLRGQDGYVVVTKYASGRPQLRTDRLGRPYIAERDSRGHQLEEEGRRVEPTTGNPLHITLDIELQAYAEALLQGEVGSIVVLEADTGAVLAMASTPTYDPSVFVNRGHSDERLALLTASRPNPMFSRSYREVYPPGSVYKIIMAAAAAEEGLMGRNTTHYCPGRFRINPTTRWWHCWRRSGHGHVNMEAALAFSCDVYFYQVGLDLGVDKIVEWSNKFGLGVRTGIDLPGEITGLIPSRDWKRETNADKPVWEQNWYPGDTVNLSIGQGSAGTTPLQNAVMMAAIVNGGYRVRPYLNEAQGPELSDRLFGDQALEWVIKGLRTCVQKGPPAPTGTGHNAHIPGYDILGKTGTAQVASLEQTQGYSEIEDIPYNLRHHAWFVAGVMDRDTKIAICVLVEHGHQGSAVAAPLARDVIEFFYERNDDTQLLARLGEVQ